MFTKRHQKEHHREVQQQEPQAPPLPPKTALKFQVQLAHGSPSCFVSGFSNVKELYQKIADTFEFPMTEVRMQ